jgi:hypothetical protein
MFTNRTKNFCIGVLVFLTGAFAQAETNLDYQKAVFRQTLKSLKTSEDAFLVMAMVEKNTDSLMIIARDLRENNVPGKMPQFDVKDNKILIDGKDSEVSIKAYSPLTLEYRNRTWAYNTKRQLDENYTDLKKFVTGPRKSAGLMRLFISEARADRLRPTEAPNPNGKDVLIDVAKFYMALGLGAGASLEANFIREFGANMTAKEMAKDIAQGAATYGAAPIAPLYMYNRYNVEFGSDQRRVVCEDGSLKIKGHLINLGGDPNNNVISGVNFKTLEKKTLSTDSQTGRALEIVKNSKGENEYYILDDNNVRRATYTYAEYDNKLIADKAAKHCFAGNMPKNIDQEIKTAIANAHAASFAHLGGAAKGSSDKSATKKGTN